MLGPVQGKSRCPALAWLFCVAFPSRPPDTRAFSGWWESVMAKSKLDGNGTLESAPAHLEDASVDADAAETNAAEQGDLVRSDVVATAATVVVVGLGAAVFEAALLPGLVLGVAAMWAPQYFPKMGEALNPLLRSTVRGAYKLRHKTKEMMAEAQEQFHDIAAEVHAEKDIEPAAEKSVAAA
jgi:hypothetical protein